MRTWPLLVLLLVFASSGFGQSRVPSSAGARKVLPLVAPTKSVQAEEVVSLSSEALQLARQVHVGTMLCEGGVLVHVQPQEAAGFFELEYKKLRYRMHAVESQTGAVRLEDRVHELMWLQLSDKSMLMSLRRGTRLADDCAGNEQAVFAQQLRLNPVRGLFDAVEVAVPGSASAKPDAVTLTSPLAERSSMTHQ